MKKAALFAAIATMFAATPAMAGGYVGLSYGNTDQSGSNADNIQVEGAFGSSASSGIGFQVDGSIGQFDSDVDTYAYAGHLYWQGSPDWRVGGVIAGSSVDGGGPLQIDEFIYGIEGTINAGTNTVIGASATFGDIELLSIEADTWNVDANIAYYVSPNFRIGGTIGTGNIESTGGDSDTMTGGLDLEYQFESMPISLNAAWTHFDADSSIETDTLSIGVRWNFGGSLRDRDNATPFNVRTPLYGRALDLR